MTENVKGGAKLGSGLEVTSSVLSLDLVDSATGTSLTADDASYLEGLTIEGKAVQNGTPTPSAPVDIEVVAGINIWDEVWENGYIKTTDGTNGVSNNCIRSKNYVPVFPGVQYYFMSEYTSATASFVVQFYDASKTFIQSAGLYTLNSVFTTPNNAAYLRFYSPDAYGSTYNKKICINVSDASINGLYLPYSALGLKVNSTITPIDLQGNVLASLPDGTKDELTVDSAGHVELVKRTWTGTIGTVGTVSGNGKYAALTASSNDERVNWDSAGDMKADAGSELPIMAYCSMLPGSTSTIHIMRTWNGLYVYSPYGATMSQGDVSGLVGASFVARNKTQTIDLGYIDPPAIPDGASISITAQVTPTITASWWARGASAIATAIKAFRDDLLARIEAIETAIADL